MTSVPDLSIHEPSGPELIAGRYALVRLLAVGGMAEVWLARQRGLEGFEKLVVVKRILPHLAKDPEFVQMFLDEARTAADLRHTNIASVTDVGTEAGAYFIAMEYLHGQDLTHVVQRCKVLGERIPLQDVLQIVCDAAQGLDYAHRKVDRHGEAQQIIHRDVSPQNLLVTYEGATKLLDFGIASASHRTTHTEAGVVKGKYAYMSPEQFDGGLLDARSDLFSLGVVLWELVTLKRLFWKPSDAETLRAVMECRIPDPSSVQADCPPELEQIILRALARNPAQRFSSCAELAQALEALSEKLRLSRSPSRVGAWLRGVFPEHTLDPTEAPAAPPSSPDARTRNDKYRPEPYPGSRTDLQKGSAGESLRARPNRVPSPAPFFGRPAELEQLQHDFQKRSRLVTLTGCAGQGKSRLAARFVELNAAQWKGKAWTVELAEARTPQALVKAVRIACGLEQSGVCQSAEEMLIEASRMLATLGPALIVLNNFELPTPAAAPVILQWLAAAPAVSFLVTRHEPLSLKAEQVLALSGLKSDGADCEAVRMFVSQLEHAGVPAPSTAAELEQVAEICRRLEGNPLAIELVASRGDTLKLDAMLHGLNGRFLLREDTGDHSTLACAIDFTCQLLSDAERQALIQLSVFQGGFRLEAADAILEVPGVVAALIEGLVRRSFVGGYIAVETPGRMRFGLHPSIHRYATRQLEAGGAVSQLRQRHARWFLERSEEWAGELQGPLAAERMALLSVERDNLGAIFEASMASAPGDAISAENALRALHGLHPILSHFGPYGDHLSMLSAAISAAELSGASKAHLARAMQERANVQGSRGQPNEALMGMAEALKVVREAGNRGLEGRILCDWSLACFASGDVDSAITGLVRSLEIARALGDAAFEVKALSLQAMVYVARRELTKALKVCDEALPLARNRGDAVSEARVLGTVGSLFLEEGRPELARAFFSDAVARCEQVDEVALKGYFLGKLAQVLAESGDLDEARAKVTVALRLLRQAGDLRNEGLFLSLSATLEALCGRHETARAVLQSAETKLEEAKDPVLLTALALRKMHLRLMDQEVSAGEAGQLLRQVRTQQGDHRARVSQSEEVRLAALQLERTLRGLSLDGGAIADVA
jgi:serine/threonine protein kinase/predicted ATPase